MKNILISWILPTTRQAGGPLDPADIQHVTLHMSADGGTNWASINDFAPDVLETPVNDLPFSDQYIVRGRVVDVADQAGDWVAVPFVLADDSPPGDLSINVTFP